GCLGRIAAEHENAFPVVRGHLAPLGLEDFLIAAAAARALFTPYKSCAFAHILFRFFAKFVNHRLTETPPPVMSAQWAIEADFVGKFAHRGLPSLGAWPV